MTIFWLIVSAVTFIVGCFVGANNPQWFKRNTASLAAIARKVQKKAEELKLLGK
jgi:hypothetical protein